MPHKQKHISHREKTAGSREWHIFHNNTPPGSPAQDRIKTKLELVLKCDSAGSVEAVSDTVLKAVPAEANIDIIHRGIGDINSSDIMLAETGSRLIAGFQVGVLPGIDRELKEHAVEVRLYDVIYKLTDDIKRIAESIKPPAQEDEILGTGKVIALFKSCRKGIIIGCEVISGHLTVGNAFRIISAAGPVYAGTIKSVHIEQNAVQSVHPGQKAGIKIEDFNKVKTGDLMESYRPPSLKRTRGWSPTGHIIRIT